MADAKTDDRLIGLRYRLALMARFALLLTLTLAVFSGLFVWLLNRRLGFGYAEDLATLSRLEAALPRVLLAAGAVQVAVGGALALVFSLCWTHAVSGPLVRVRRTLQALARGEAVQALRFRKTDQLHGLAGAFQELLDAEQRRRQAVAEALDEASSLISAVVQAPGDPASRASRDALRRVYEALRRRLESGGRP